MARVEDLQDQLARFNVEDEENAELVFDDEVVADTNRFDLCLVGRFLTEKGINVRAMKSKLADIWRPTRGITIKEIKSGVFLFQFYHADDLQWVIKGGPWSFDNVMLLISVIPDGADPLHVPLFEIQFWIQIQGLPAGFMTETIGKQLGNFFGTFISYDPNNNSSIWRESMRLKIAFDVRRPLKRKKKICRKDGSEWIVQCKYERLGEFCFVCGLVTHIERYCMNRSDSDDNGGIREWGVWLRAPPRKTAGLEKSRWLREEKDVDWGKNHGGDSYYQQQSAGNEGGKSKDLNYVRDSRDVVNGKPIIKDISGTGTVSNYRVDLQVINKVIGPSFDELTGLNIEERKRRRSSPDSEFMETDGVNETNSSEPVLSNTDCAGSPSTVLAKLAQQASQIL